MLSEKLDSIQLTHYFMEYAQLEWKLGDQFSQRFILTVHVRFLALVEISVSVTKSLIQSFLSLKF